LFEIENHGLRHHPCSINGQSIYGIRGTENPGQAVDEIELKCAKNSAGHPPEARLLPARQRLHRTRHADGSPGSWGSRSLVMMCLSGDAIAGTPTEVNKKQYCEKARNGAIVIMHMNHPEWNGYEALREAIPELQKVGYRLSNFRAVR